MSSRLWSAPVADGPLDAVVEIPGSKSLTNRHLVVAALADAPTRVVGALRSRDTDLMVEALSALGVGFEWIDSSTLLVTPLAEEALREEAPVSIDCGLAGTVMRFVPYVAALLRRPVTFDGDAAARVRPMGAVIAGLRALGADVVGGEDGFLPFTVTGSDRVAGGEISLDASGSSQFVSGPLLVGARLPRGLVVRHSGGAVPSPQHVEMTVETLRAAGVDAAVGSDGVSWSVAAGPLQPGDVVVEPDLSNAGPFLAAAGVHPESREAATPYYGYLYRIMQRQGANAPGGAYDYVINGNMIAGFAMIAYPDQYGKSGVMTFIVSHQGKVYQKDLGPKTLDAARSITEYNPDSTWTLVQ